MEIHRAQYQSSETFLEFYDKSKWGDDERFVGGAEAMQRLLRHLADVPGPTVWGCTSHQTLILEEGPTEGPALVHIRATIVDLARCESDSHFEFGYYIAYPMPQSSAPWPGARVHGTAMDVESATAMILASVRHSGASSQMMRDAAPFRYNCPSCEKSSSEYFAYCGHCRHEWPDELKMQAIGLFRR